MKNGAANLEDLEDKAASLSKQLMNFDGEAEKEKAELNEKILELER